MLTNRRDNSKMLLVEGEYSYRLALILAFFLTVKSSNRPKEPEPDLPKKLVGIDISMSSVHAISQKPPGYK